MRILQGEMQVKLDEMRREREKERTYFEKERTEMELQMDDITRRAEWAERELQIAKDREENTVAQVQQRQERESRMNANKLAETLALLDDREETIGQLQTKLHELQTRVNEHQEGALDARHEMEDLLSENASLRVHYQRVEAENSKLKAKLNQLKADSEKLSGLKVSIGFDMSAEVE